MRRKLLYFLLLFWFFGDISINPVCAQDPQFTQFYANPLYLNPAFAGVTRCPRLIMNYRNQWPALSGTFVTYSASYDQHVDALSGGLGVLVMNDRAGRGTLNSVNAAAMYSYELTVNRHFSIRAALQAGYFQKSLDWNKLHFGDMIDSRYGFINQTQEIQGLDMTNGADFAAGILGYSDKFYFGFSSHHLHEPQEAFISPGNSSRLPRKYTGHVGALIPFDNRNPDEGSISPNILYHRQRDFSQLNLGVYVSKGPIIGGLWYRNQDAFILLVGIHTDVFKFGYSYDVTVSRLSSATAGSHEISMALQFACKPKRRRFRPVSCPSF